MSTTKEKLKATAKDVQDSANQIWLAGLGAFSNAQEESEKVFESLVKQGEVFENKTSKNVRKQLQLAESQIESLRLKANDSLSKVELALEDHIQKVLKRLGVPTREDIERLHLEIEELRAAMPEPRKWMKRSA